MRLADETPDDLNDEARAWELLAPWDVTPANARLERHAVYTFQARYARRWRAGRVFVAGDAAHQMPPFAGQGMCAGIRDAANLAWKLDLVIDGRAANALLDSYDVERLPSARQAIEFSMELGKVICVPDAEEAAARDAAMAASVTAELAEAPELPGIDEGCVDAGHPHAGRLFVQGTDGGRPFDDVHGAGWRLVTAASDVVLDTDFASWFASIGGAVITVDDDEHARWFTATGTTAVLERPDFHVFGAAETAPEAVDLVARLRHHLRPVPATSGSAP